jgi:integrase
MLGLRTEEVLALRWRNLDGGYISIEKAITLDYDIDPDTLKVGKSKTVLANTKTAGSVRDIPVNGYILSILEEWKTYAARKTKTRFSENDFIFGNSQFPRWSYSGYRDAINDVLVEKGVSKIRLHQARHTAATLAVRNGASVLEVRDLLGHKQLSTTEGYITRNSDMVRKASSAVNQGFSAILGSDG